MSPITGYHHLTPSTDGVREDDDFQTRTPGRHSVKRTGLFDGALPVCHVCHGAHSGDASTIITTFPFRKPAICGRHGSIPSRIMQQAIPVAASDFRVNRLNDRGIAAEKTAQFGTDRLAFCHPCGIPHERVESAGDARPACAGV